MKKSFFGPIILAVCLGKGAVAQEHRQLDAHEHGHGTLNVAIEGNRVSMELEAPGMDIVGFEHQPQTKKEEATASQAESTLKRGLSLFKVPSAAGCKLLEAKVHTKGDDHHDHDDHGHDKSTDHSHAHDKDHAHEKSEVANGRSDGTHSEYHAIYELECAKPAALTGIEFGYFKIFPGTKALTINVVTDAAQRTYEVTPAQPVIDLGGVM